MRFMMLMIPEVYRKNVPTEFRPDPEAIRKMGEYNEALKKAGALLSLDGLTPPSVGARISFAGGKAEIVDDRPLEAIGGYWIVQVNSQDEAIAWAKRCPAAAGDIIEIRRIFELDDFGPDAGS